MALFNDLTANGAEVRDVDLLNDIQGNILRGYNRVRTFLCFIRFGDDAQESRDWVDRNLLGANAKFPVTSARHQNLDARQQPERLVNVMLTKSGLEKLDCPQARIGDMDEAFRRDVLATRAKLGDEAGAFAEEYAGPWDALVLVNCDAAKALDARSDLEAFANDVEQIWIEDGNALDAEGYPLGDGADSRRFEPFGFRDGISQLLFSQEHVNAVRSREPGPVLWSSERELSVVLVPDRLSERGFGSYFVFRKLRQDVAEFDARVKQIAEGLLAPHAENGKSRGAFLSELYGAGAFDIFAQKAAPSAARVEAFVKTRMMGRAPTGEALTPPGNQNPAPEAFDYSDDRDGRVCPFYAHVRKMNPRGGTGEPEKEKGRSIARRGVPYGSRSGEETGLLFLCAQRNISDQFEFHQANWASIRSTELSEEPTPAPDNISAQPPSVPDHIKYGDKLGRYRRYTSTIDVDVRAYPFVRLRGSEYLLAPSLSGLRLLVAGGVR